MHNKEIYATGFVKPKTTALFFDKLFIPHEQAINDRVPSKVLFKYKGKNEAISRKIIKEMFYEYHKICPKNSPVGLDRIQILNNYELNPKIFDEFCQDENSKRNTQNKSDRRFLFTHYRNSEIKSMVNEMWSRFHINIVPIFF